MHVASIFLTSTHTLCFGTKICKIGIPLHTPVLLLLYKSGVLRGYTFHRHVFLMQRRRATAAATATATTQSTKPNIEPSTSKPMKFDIKDIKSLLKSSYIVPLEYLVDLESLT